MSCRKKSIPGAGQQVALARGDVPGREGCAGAQGSLAPMRCPSQARARAAGCGHQASEAGEFGLPEYPGVVLSLRLPPPAHSGGCRCARLTTHVGAAAMTRVPINSSTAPLKTLSPLCEPPAFPNCFVYKETQFLQFPSL